MMKLNLNNSKILNLITNNTQSGKEVSPELVKMQKSIMLKGALALLTVVLTVVILFAMTSAWYTNIVQTSGLVFEVESWGFSGEIIVDNNENIKFAPGDEGTVSITANNESDEITPLTVNVSKPYMNEEMQKRLFFYVDTPMTRNGETMERVYINEKEGYTYNLFGGSSLIINEEVKNAPELKWQWVYDMLGYYVLATPQEAEKESETGVTVTNGETDEENTAIRMEIEEYLRPIEYDFDKATFNEKTFELETVDGTTTVATFLQELFASDGYSTDENTAVAMINNELEGQSGTYYPVDIDENGHGVYAYLCSYTEIELATKFDTDLGDLAYRAENDLLAEGENTSLLTHTAELVFSAETLAQTPKEIANLAELKEAFKAGEEVYVKLASDINLESETLSVPEGADITIDLGGNTITAASGQNAIKTEAKSSVTLLNGTIKGTDKTGKGIEAIGTELTLNKVNIEGFDRGIDIIDYSGTNETDSAVRLVECNISGELCAVFINGNGTASEQKTGVVIENCTFTSSGYGIVSNGSANRAGTDITVINSTVTSIGTDYNDGTDNKWGVGIYHPQMNSTLTIYNSRIEGLAGVVIKGGDVTVISKATEGMTYQSTVIKGTGKAATPEAILSGSADTGDGIYIENNYTDRSVSLTIKGDTGLKSENDHALRVYSPDLNNYSVTIEQGTFVSPEAALFRDSWLASGSAQTIATNTVSVTKSGTAEQ
ncbi:MAG: right-handed parallel beta-helix repeat-containing protein [Oscillospiraceae bacterium]|nr:right-handed parallel beta-helix repeat-containing protein [Oscillospiraceae bacterium]